MPNSGIIVENIGASLVRKKNKIKGEKVWCKFDGYKMALVVYNGQAKVTRVDINKE
jgi:hypothetical protein